MESCTATILLRPDGIQICSLDRVRGRRPPDRLQGRAHPTHRECAQVVARRSFELTSAMVTTGEHINRSQDIINLAYEGVPQRAIARALQLPANEVGEVVADAVARGIIIEPSESEWPRGSCTPRHPAFAGPPIDEGALLAAAQSLALTKTQAALFLALVRRKFCTNEILHGIVESRRRAHSAMPATGAISRIKLKVSLS